MLKIVLQIDENKRLAANIHYKFPFLNQSLQQLHVADQTTLFES